MYNFIKSLVSNRLGIVLVALNLCYLTYISQNDFGLMKTAMDQGEPPTAFIPEAKEIADRYAKIIDGKPTVLLNETLFLYLTDM